MHPALTIRQFTGLPLATCLSITRMSAQGLGATENLLHSLGVAWSVREVYCEEYFLVLRGPAGLCGIPLAEKPHRLLTAYCEEVNE